MPENNHSEVLEAIHELANQVDQRFSDLETRMDKRFTKIEAVMVTKDYLDDKLADLKGDLIVKQRKIEDRINALVNVLSDKNLLQSADVKLLSDLRVFPHIGE